MLKPSSNDPNHTAEKKRYEKNPEKFQTKDTANVIDNDSGKVRRGKKKPDFDLEG